MAVPARVAAETSFTVNTNVATFTKPYTCVQNPGSDRLLVAFVATDDDTFPTNAVVAYNGVTMTTAVARVYTGSSPDRGVRIYYLLNADIPNDGASHDFTISTDANLCKVLMVEYINIAQGAPEDTDNVGLSTGAGTLTLTASADAVLVDCYIVVATGLTVTHGTDQNKFAQHTALPGSVSCSDKLPAAHSGGAVTMSASSTGTTGAYCAAVWAPAAGIAAAGMSYPPTGRRFQHMLVR